MFIEQTYVLAALLNIKEKYFQEKFVTVEELSFVTNALQKKFNQNNMQTCIVNKLDTLCFKSINGILFLRKDNCLDIKNVDEYLRIFLADDINSILSDEYLCECLFEIKLKQIENCKDKLYNEKVYKKN